MVAAKRAWLDEIIGTIREKGEEPEGKVLGESSTGSLLFPPLFITLWNKFMFVLVYTALLYNFPLQMNPKKKMKRQNLWSKRRKDVDVLHSWMEVGGHPAHPEEEAKGLLAEVNAFLCFFFLSHSSLNLLFAYLLPILPSQSWCLDFYWLFSSFFVGFETALPDKWKEGGS